MVSHIKSNCQKHTLTGAD